MFRNPLADQRKELVDAENRQLGRNKDQIAFQTSAASDVVEIAQHEQRTDLLKWQQNLKDEIEALKHRLRREVKDGDKWEPLKKLIGKDPQTSKRIFEDLPPYMNELGICMVEDQIWPLTSRNIINTNLQEERILKILERTCNAIADNMADNFDMYDARFVDYDIILTMVKNIIIPAPFRSLGGWNKKMDNETTRRIESLTDTANQQIKKGFFT